MTAVDKAMHPYFQAAIDAYAAAGRPYFHQVSPVEARAMMSAAIAAAPPPVGLPALKEVRDERIDGPHGPIPIRIYVPSELPIGTCVYFHAGGWVIGDLAISDGFCRRLAAAARCEVISVDYRLAPEHPYPQPLDDAYAAMLWAARERAGEPLVIAGESAGANLAAACAIRARDTDGPTVAGQFLAYPVTDHDWQTESHREVGDKNWLLSTADMQWFFDHYVSAGHDPDDALVAPMRVADAAGLPPAMIVVGELDPLRDDGLRYAVRLREAGVPVATRRDAGMLHGYLSAAGAIPLAAEAVAEAAEWVRTCLDEAAQQAPGAAHFR